MCLAFLVGITAFLDVRLLSRNSAEGIYSRIYNFTEMESLDPAISKLQEAFSTIGVNVNLPQIVAVGSQSSGKSSVIENLVGRSFLPRGAGIVTRCPLILHLLKDSGELSKRESASLDWATFKHNNKIFTDFDEVREEIIQETERIAGDNLGISSEPIVLKIYSPRFLNLTLVDLPGLTRIPVGDQPENIEHLIRELVQQYIRNPHCIMLAIVTANTDIATCESLKIAREVDKDGKRTLAVVTKLDLMDKGTDAMNLLLGEAVNVPLGIVGVVNRSQQDIVDDKSMKNALEDEEIFFSTNYPTIAQRSGTPYLIKVLIGRLKHHIRNCLPDLRQQVDALILQQQTKIDFLGGENNIDEKDKKKTLLEKINRFASSYTSTLDGTAREVETSQLTGGARINYIFHETFRGTLERIEPLGGLTRVQILTAMKNVNGVRPAALFVPELSFYLLVKQQISRLIEPSLRCVHLVHKELKRIVNDCGSEVQQDMSHYPNLHRRIIKVTSDLFNRRLPVTNEMVTNLVRMHSAYINTLQPDFHQDAVLASSSHFDDIVNTLREEPRSATIVRAKSSDSSIASVKSLTGNIFCNSSQVVDASRTSIHEAEEGKKLWSEKDQKDCAVIERLVESYYRAVRRTVQDAVPKAVMYFLVNYVQDNLRNELLTEVYDKNGEDLMGEAEEVVKSREEATAALKALRQAVEIVDEISYYHMVRNVAS